MTEGSVIVGKSVVPTKQGILTFSIPPNGYCFIPVCLLMAEECVKMFGDALALGVLFTL